MHLSMPLSGLRLLPMKVYDEGRYQVTGFPVLLENVPATAKDLILRFTMGRLHLSTEETTPALHIEEREARR